MRYFEAGWEALWSGSGSNTRFSVMFRVVKRAAPTITVGPPRYGGDLRPASILQADADGFLPEHRAGSEMNYSWAATAEL